MTEALLVCFILFSLFSLLAAIKINKTYGLMALYIFYVFISQITINLQVEAFGITMTIGSMMFASLSVCIDVINELYGKKEANKVINAGVMILVSLFLIINLIRLIQPVNNEYSNNFHKIFFNQNRIIITDVFLSYFIFQKLDVWIFDYLRKLTIGKHLWLRGGVSTIISQTLIAVSFYEICFFNIWSQNVIINVIISGLIIKYIYSLLEIPILYLSKRLTLTNAND